MGGSGKNETKTTHNVIHLGHKCNDMDKMFQKISGGKKGETLFRIVYWGGCFAGRWLDTFESAMAKANGQTHEERRCKVGRKDGR